MISMFQFYNLGMPNLGTRRKRNAAIFPKNEKVGVQKKTWKYCLRVAAIITKRRLQLPLS